MTSFYFNDNIDNATTLTNFVPFDDDIGLPFPLNTHPIVRFLLATSLLFVLVYGTHLRIKIFSFLWSSEANQGPINTLIWIDQVTG